MNVTISEDDLKDIIEKLKLDLLKYTKPNNWLDSVPERHRKFAAYWDELGRPELEISNNEKQNWVLLGLPDWTAAVYRIKNDPHWELRLKWVNSDKTLPIEVCDTQDGKWRKTTIPAWFKGSDYREAKPWYEQEISNEKPMILKDNRNYIILWTDLPRYLDDWTPLTDQEIDALKRGF